MGHIRQRLTFFAIAVLLVFSGSVVRADMTIRERRVKADGSETVTISKQKGNRVRVDTEGVPVSIIVEEASENFHALLHPSREYMIVNAREYGASLKAQNPGEEPSVERLAPQSLGKTEQIGDFSAELYQIQHKMGESTLEHVYWVVKDHPQASTFGETVRILKNSGLGEIHEGPSTVALGFPAVLLKSEVWFNGELQETVTLEAVSSEVLDEALFAPPKDYARRQQ